MKKIKKLKPNKGLNWKLELKHRKPEDHLGGAGVCIAEIPEEEREIYLPAGEIQNLGEEKMDCASRAPLNIGECKFDWLVHNEKLPATHVKFLTDKGYLKNGMITFSDRWIAIKSGTNPDSGNSLIAPLDACHRYGLIPKSMFPQVESKEEYYDKSKITAEMEKVAEEFLSLFSIGYARLSETEFPQFLVRDMLVVGGYAWPSPVNDEYPSVSYQPNHAFVVWKNPRYFAFDNYEDSVDDAKEEGNAFVKKLASDYNFLDTGYRLIISLKTEQTEQANIIVAFLIWLFHKVVG